MKRATESRMTIRRVVEIQVVRVETLVVRALVEIQAVRVET